MSWRVRLNKLFSVLSLCLGLMLALSAGAEETLPVAKVAIPEVWPWGYQGADGEPRGLLPTLVEGLSTAADMPFRQKLRPHRRALKELEAGEADFTIMFESPAAANAGIAVAPLVTTRVLLVVRAGDLMPAALDERMVGKSVGYIRGTYYGEAFEKAEWVQKVAVQDLRQAIEMLILRRVDAVISSEHVYHHTVKAMGVDAALFNTGAVVNEMHGVLYVSKKSDFIDEIPRLRSAIRKMRDTGRLEEIFSFE